jgi:hypothetical protein
MRLVLILTENRGDMTFFLELTELELIDWATVNRELNDERDRKMRQK